ncbi:MAG: PhoH family protein [Bacteroidia bacterium]|nr:PhoH family protein [Bacteroidia bacterium]
MMEKLIILEGIDPVDIYGVNDTRLEKMKGFFPKLKIVGRGNELKANGEETEILKFEEKIGQLITHLEKYNYLTNNDFEKIIVENGFKGSGSYESPDIIIYGTSGKPIKALTPNQMLMIEKYQSNDLIFAIGPAGTGKTYTAIALAVRALKNREVKRIVLSRPAVETGESLGFLPGDMKEKIDPYLQPLYDALYDMIPPKRLDDYMHDNVVQIAPLAYMRGRTLDNAFVILDEAQNATLNQFKMFVTRMGTNSKFIITGDITQIDLPRKQSSGLLLALRILQNIEGISIIEFNTGDISRHKLVKQIVEAYDKLDRKNENESSLEKVLNPDNQQNIDK